MELRKKLIFVMVLLLLSLVGAASAQHGGGSMGSMGLPQVGPDVTIRFAASVNGVPAACGLIYDGVGVEGSTVSLTDFRLYVSNVRLINAAGEEVPVELAQDGQWQYANVALLDFEDGSSLCSSTGNADLNTKIVGTVPEGMYTGLAFDLGVPFELNHLDTVTAPSPLNIPAMWWNWQVGYKFVRIDLLTPGGEAPAWFVHLGSTGCASSDGNTPPAEPCSNPNVTSVRFDSFDPVRQVVSVDAGALLSGVNLAVSVPMPPGCMSGPEDSDCAGLFPAFGLDLASGMPVDGPQNFFHVVGSASAH
jgi:uncharacterized repeat protein (TIGR04052 family)